jgi:hypothetical protein
VRTGGSLRTRIGVLAIEAVDAVEPQQVTEAEAARAGFASRAALLEALARRSGTLYRIALRKHGEDPRVALRQARLSSTDEREEISGRLARLDRASKTGPWTRSYLELIRARPARRAPDLAGAQGLDTPTFKRRVRQLKELGLTESLDVGYRLSPRGASYLEALDAIP